MSKKVVKKIKLQIQAGKASAQPPVGTALGPAGINIQEFCVKFNDMTRDQGDDLLPVEISLYDDRSFDFIVKKPPASYLIKKQLKINKGSSKGSSEVVAKITKEQIKEIAEIKKEDLNAYDLEKAIKIIEGTAKNMGIEIE